MQKKLLFQTASNFIAAFTIVMLVLAALPVSSAHAATSTDTYSTAGTFTWTAPAGVTSVTVQVWGGGGRGGSISGGYGEATGGGGGGGAYSSKTNIAVTPGNGYTVVVGAGSNSTSAGGNSYFITRQQCLLGAAIQLHPAPVLAEARQLLVSAIPSIPVAVAQAEAVAVTAAEAVDHQPEQLRTEPRHQRIWRHCTKRRRQRW